MSDERTTESPSEDEGDRIVERLLYGDGEKGDQFGRRLAAAYIEKLRARLRNGGHKEEEIARTGFYTVDARHLRPHTVCTYCGCVVGEREIHRRACFDSDLRNSGGEEQ